MSIFRRKKQTDAETESLKSFLDMIAPSIVKFETGYYICGNTFRCIWALREYPTSTDDLAILRHLGEKHGVTLHIYTRMVSPHVISGQSYERNPKLARSFLYKLKLLLYLTLIIAIFNANYLLVSIGRYP